ncbi:sieve element occlusion protein [Tasmannia lanceolata]|uniref:sieve element occlusion protein n=1 Tax=Tasmannia lanceolata TaxID=3420 RepID=UPI0040632D3E
MSSSYGKHSLFFSSSEEEDMVMKKILETHEPDGRQFDSKAVLRAIENTLHHAFSSNVRVLMGNAEATMVKTTYAAEIIDIHEPLGHTIFKLSREITYKKCSGKGNLHATTMMLFDSLRNYSWDAKVVIALAAFVTIYAEFLLITELYNINPLATLLAIIKQLPNNLEDFEALKPRFKAIGSLAKVMVDAAKCIVEFASLPMQYMTVDVEAMTMKILTHVATYWVIRSAVVCSSHITDLMAMNHEQVLTTTIGVTWELWSLVHKVCNLHDHLRKQLDVCEQYIEGELYQRLLHIFEETHNDNEEVLNTLFSRKEGLLNCSGFTQEKFGIEVLKSKEIILLVSKLDISQEKLLFILHQTYDHPNHKANGSYEIVWVVLPNSISWTRAEEKAFHQLANTLPWYSISQPWSLRRAVVNYILKVWHLDNDLLMVVLDQKGRITCRNAMDMILIWGLVAYPFSTSREEQLWDEASWTLDFIIGEIDPLISMWIGEGRTICLYGSDNLEWIREFTGKINDIKRVGVPLELVYVGNNSTREHTKEIAATIVEERLSGSLSQTGIYFFWARLKSIRSSRTHIGKDMKNDVIMKEVMSMLSHDDEEKGWVVMGRGSSTDTIKLHGRKLMDCLALFNVWGENVEKVGFLSAMRNSLDPPPPPPIEKCNCNTRNHSRIIPYVRDSNEEIVICEECKRPMEKCVLYQCMLR